MPKINKISAETMAAIRNKSAYALPINPTDAGLRPGHIRDFFHKPLTDVSNSLASEIDRVAEEADEAFEQAEKEKEQAEKELDAKLLDLQKKEQARSAAEALRVEAEQARSEAEALRVEAEQARSEAEALRVEAEQERSEAEKSREENATELSEQVKVTLSEAEEMVEIVATVAQEEDKIVSRAVEILSKDNDGVYVGMWYLPEPLADVSMLEDQKTYNFAFSCYINGPKVTRKYTGLRRAIVEENSILRYLTASDSALVYRTKYGAFSANSYQTITISSEPPDEIKRFLDANGRYIGAWDAKMAYIEKKVEDFEKILNEAVDEIDSLIGGEV